MRIVHQVHRLSGPLIRSGLPIAANLIAANLIAANLIAANLIAANLIAANLIAANLIAANLIAAIDVREQLRLRGCRQQNYFRSECVSADSIH